ncbi:MAG: hypothetical protein KDD44_11520 [Bdellovibrionales bacterium]|nr:hypothetical protein [Bdellovibrionales bacterium]
MAVPGATCPNHKGGEERFLPLAEDSLAIGGWGVPTGHPSRPSVLFIPSDLNRRSLMRLNSTGPPRTNAQMVATNLTAYHDTGQATRPTTTRTTTKATALTG